MEKNNSKKKETEPWTQRNKVSKACTLLFKLFMDRTSGIQNMPKEKNWKSHESFQDYPLKDFEEYVNDIVEKTNSRKKIINEEEEAFTERWLGGMMTNFQTIRKSIKKMNSIDAMLADGSLSSINKKEKLTLTRERNKLEKVLALDRYLCCQGYDFRVSAHQTVESDSKKFT